MKMMNGDSIQRYLREIEWDRVLKLDEKEWSRLVSQEIEITYPERRFLDFYVAPLAPETSGESGAVVILRDVTHDRLSTAHPHTFFSMLSTR